MNGAEFRVKDSFVLDHERLFVLQGQIVAGAVAPGMVLTVQNPGQRFRMAVHSVEFVDSPGRQVHDVGLTLYMGKRQWADLLAAAFPSGAEILIGPVPERFHCPCCGHRTLDEQPPGTYAICEVCFWEDDPIQFRDAEYEGGANVVSLRQARANYLAIGASEPRFVGSVRSPRKDELAL